MQIPSLAETQLEREKINAKKAKDAYFKAFKNSITLDDANKIRIIISSNIATEFKVLARQLADSIDGEKDETKIHYLMTDTIITWANEAVEKIGDKITEIDAEVAEAFKRNLRPKPIMTVSQCAEKYRYLKTGTNMPGPWRNENAPIIKEIMDALSLHSPVKKVTFKKSSGISGTEIGLNWLLYIVKHAKKDLMVVSPDKPLLKRTFIPRIRKLFKESKGFKEEFRGTDSEDLIEIGDTKITTAYATNEDSFRAEHVIYTWTSEKSAMPLMIGSEGDIGMLTENRRKTYSRRKSYDESSPTVEGLCQISDDYDEGSQESCYIFCPHCNHAHTFEFKNFRWTKSPQDKSLVVDAYFVCPECNGRIEESQKNELIDNHVWIAKYPERMDTHRSFTANSFYIKFGLGLTWVEIAQKWLKAQEDSAKLVTFMNTYLAETSQIDFESVDASSLMSRLETFPDEMPPVARLFGGDVQGDRIELTIFDFEESTESWAQTHIILPGNPKELDDQIWSDLKEVKDKFHIDFGCLDSGYLPKQVYMFCKENRWCHPTKGQPGQKVPFVEDQKQRAKKLRSRSKYGIKPEMLGVHTGKLLIHSRLRQENKTTYDYDNETGEILKINRVPMPGYIHFRNDSCFDVKYFEQLTAERLEKIKRKGYTIEEWKNHGVGGRNEAFDCAVYAAAAFYIAKEMKKLRFREKPSIQQIEDCEVPVPKIKKNEPPKPNPKKNKQLNRRKAKNASVTSNSLFGGQP